MPANTQINVRMDDETLKRLDSWRKQQEDFPGRPEAIRRLVEMALEPKKRK